MTLCYAFPFISSGICSWAITSDDPEFGGQGNPDTGADFWAAPDLDHANPKLREALQVGTGAGGGHYEVHVGTAGGGH